MAGDSLPKTGEFSASLDQDALSQFRQQVKQAKHDDAIGWDLTRKLVEAHSLQATLQQLAERIGQKGSCSPSIQEKLLAALSTQSFGAKTINAGTLKEFTGLPPTKALRALCLYFNLVNSHLPPDAAIDPRVVEDFVWTHPNPYDWLLNVDTPSLLDLGAGDLSFEEELLNQYSSKFQHWGKSLTLHALDRLQPGSQFGGVYHANQERLTRFTQQASRQLNFRFWGAKDMLNLSTPRDLLKTYSIVTCHAPATPTFAFEPTRVSQRTIEEHLKQTKGEFKTVRFQGEEALEVKHRGRTLTFPSWKFAIRGPLSLLDLVARRGQLCILSAIDSEVFWEILAQLVEDKVLRPRNVIFTEENIPEIFQDVFESLSSLKEGEGCSLSKVTSLRTQLPHVLMPPPRGASGFRFRYVEVRRGAIFPDMPASFTARQFSQMTEEAHPWCLILVPEQLKQS